MAASRPWRDVSLSLEAGEIVALIGPNGAGKSTCFNMLNGQIRPDSGTIALSGRDITGWPPREVWRLGVGRTFQITATFASMTVIENVQTVLLSHERRAWPAVGTRDARQPPGGGSPPRPRRHDRTGGQAMRGTCLWRPQAA